MINRRKTKVIKIGPVYIGGQHPVAIQSMAKTKTSDIEKTVAEIKRLENSGCEIVRVAVRDSQDALAIKKIKPKIRIPLVADIHFHWQMAMDAIEGGADKIRLNPGNIYRKEEIREVARAAKVARVPIRVGVNSGSLRRTTHAAPRTTIPDLMVSNAIDYIKILEGFKFHDIVISLKASNILDTIEAYRKMAKLCDYPLHLGVTATGLPQAGSVKSSIAIGTLLLEGIGDTIRISLTAEPQEEIGVAKAILEALGLRSFGAQIISCPTCGRCEVDLVRIVKELENALSRYPAIRLSRSTGKRADGQTGKPIKVAVMGCVVNGPGEAREADIGVAFGKREGLLFKNGKPIRKVSYLNCIGILLKELEKMNAQDIKR